MERNKSGGIVHAWEIRKTCGCAWRSPRTAAPAPRIAHLPAHVSFARHRLARISVYRACARYLYRGVNLSVTRYQ